MWTKRVLVKLRWLSNLQENVRAQKNSYYLKLVIGNKNKIYKTIILPVVLYGCEAWPLTLREECRLRVFENRILG